MVAVDWFIVNLRWIRRQGADQEVKEELVPRIAAQFTLCDAVNSYSNFALFSSPASSHQLPVTSHQPLTVGRMC